MNRTGRGGAGWNRAAIGAERLNCGYRQVKVASKTNSRGTNWRHLHHVVWEAAHGPLKKGERLRFKNGNTKDCRLDNLELTTTRAMLDRNSVHNLPAEIISALYWVGRLNLRIKREEQARRSA